MNRLRSKSGAPLKIALTTALALVLLSAVASVSQAAAPAWKLLAATGPTDLPPVQSETQRITVEAEGGSFAASYQAAGAGTPVTHAAHLSFTAGSAEATITEVDPGASLAIGDRVTIGQQFEFAERLVVSCSADCRAAGSTVTLSEPASVTQSDVGVVVFTKELSGVAEAGGFQVGDEIVGSHEIEGTVYDEYFPAGTTVTAVGANTLTLSNPTTFEYVSSEGALEVTGPLETSGSIAYDASASDVQAALGGMPALSGGKVSVLGGPGGDGGQPYLLVFGGALADKNVPQVTVDSTGLVGPSSAVNVFTTVPGGPGTGEISINPANVGGLDTSGEYTVELGPLPSGIVTRGVAHAIEGVGGWTCAGGGGEVSVTCTSNTPVSQLGAAGTILVPIEIDSAAEGDSSVSVTISGGNARPDSIRMPIKVSAQPAPQGVSAFWAGAFDADGNPETQAGGHPYSAMSYFLLNTVRLANGHIATPGDPRDVLVDLPPGFSGNPLVTPRCPQSQLTPPVPGSGNSAVCSESSRVGLFTPAVNQFGELPPGFRAPIYNDVPAAGSAAEFTTLLVFPFQSLLGSVRSSEDGGIRISALNVPNYVPVFGSFAALEGFPASAGGSPFLSNPTSCAESAREAPVTGLQTDVWQQSGAFSSPVESAQPVLTGCDRLTFAPGFSFLPTVSTGSSGTGAVADLHIPQEGLTDPGKLATPALKKAVVQLPSGLSLDAAAANGLQSCSEQQIGFKGASFPLPSPIRFDEAPPACPDGSKLGTIEVDSPLLEAPLTGTIYLAAQEENPFGSLLAVYLAIESPRFGLQIKLAGKVDIDPTTGQLTATFDYNPQLPFEDLKLLFRGGGPRSPLATPEVCGHYATAGSLEPWSAPESGPSAQIQEGGFDISSGCSGSAASRPFAPSLEAGTVATQAGSYSPLVIKVGRKDGEQELKSLDFTLPKGLLAKVAGIPYCSEASIRNAESKAGKAEQASASCPVASQIGTVDAAAGVGSEPFHVGGKVYLAGPYRGAPLSAVVITPAVAGPFDLGDVVIRTPLHVDPETAQITAKSDPIPTILKGIPLKLRSVAVYLDRPGFTLNPTSCDPMEFSAQAVGTDGAVARLANRFQVGGCNGLAFKPELKLSLKGSTKRSGVPAPEAVLTNPPGNFANVSQVSTVLPKTEFIDNAHIGNTCTRVQFNAGAGQGAECPANSILGHAKAYSPLLEEPLEGTVYLRSNGGERELPDLVVALKGQVDVTLVGFIDSVQKNKHSEVSRLRARFMNVPDAPVSHFVLQLAGAKHGLLENSANLCKVKNVAQVKMVAQNGKTYDTQTTVANDCGKGKPRKAGKKRGR